MCMQILLLILVLVLVLVLEADSQVADMPQHSLLARIAEQGVKDAHRRGALSPPNRGVMYNKIDQRSVRPRRQWLFLSERD